MPTSRRFAYPMTSLAVVGLCTLCAVPAAANGLDDIVSHRAVYDMTLADVAEGSGLTALAGRLVYDLQGTRCDGFAVNFRLVTQFVNRAGERTTTDLRSSTFEEELDAAGGTGRFQFLTRNFVNQIGSDETDGAAAREGEALAITLKKPEEGGATLPVDALFPTEHLGHLLDAAREGRRVFQAAIYDGSEDGATANDTTAIIGAARQADDHPFTTLSGRTYWPVTLSYYEVGQAGGDQLPSYEISFDLYDNGISDALTLDYGDFTVDGALSSLDMSDGAAACPPG